MSFRTILIFLLAVTTNGVGAWNVGGTPATPPPGAKATVAAVQRPGPTCATTVPTATPNVSAPSHSLVPTPFTRTRFLQQTTTITVASALALVLGRPRGVSAAGESGATNDNDNAGRKRTNLSDDELKDIVRADIVQRKFLTNGKLTRSIYDEAATFTDEIDTYTLDKWIAGTQKLFVGDKSRVDLVGDIDVTQDRVEFRFDEDLMFNLPFVKPVVSLTGKVVLRRSPETGLITSYQEFWDQDVTTVLKSAKF
jgi:hypothetical protein